MRLNSSTWYRRDGRLTYEACVELWNSRGWNPKSQRVRGCSARLSKKVIANNTSLHLLDPAADPEITDSNRPSFKVIHYSTTILEIHAEGRFELMAIGYHHLSVTTLRRLHQLVGVSGTRQKGVPKIYQLVPQFEGGKYTGFSNWKMQSFNSDISINIVGSRFNDSHVDVPNVYTPAPGDSIKQVCDLVTQRDLDLETLKEHQVFNSNGYKISMEEQICFSMIWLCAYNLSAIKLPKEYNSFMPNYFLDPTPSFTAKNLQAFERSFGVISGDYLDNFMDLAFSGLEEPEELPIRGASKRVQDLFKRRAKLAGDLDDYSELFSSKLSSIHTKMRENFNRFLNSVQDIQYRISANPYLTLREEFLNVSESYFDIEVSDVEGLMQGEPEFTTKNPAPGTLNPYGYSYNPPTYNLFSRKAVWWSAGNKDFTPPSVYGFGPWRRFLFDLKTETHCILLHLFQEVILRGWVYTDEAVWVNAEHTTNWAYNNANSLKRLAIEYVSKDKCIDLEFLNKKVMEEADYKWTFRVLFSYLSIFDKIFTAFIRCSPKNLTGAQPILSLQDPEVISSTWKASSSPTPKDLLYADIRDKELYSLLY